MNSIINDLKSELAIINSKLKLAASQGSTTIDGQSVYELVFIKELILTGIIRVNEAKALEPAPKLAA